VLAKLNQDFRRVLAMPDVHDTFLNKGGFDPVGSSIESFTQLIPEEIDRWGKLVHATGAKVE
jgi:tripartite-type tricarboxylate transporter receptor subunit TctC